MKERLSLNNTLGVFLSILNTLAALLWAYLSPYSFWVADISFTCVYGAISLLLIYVAYSPHKFKSFSKTEIIYICVVCLICLFISPYYNDNTVRNHILFSFNIKDILYADVTFCYFWWFIFFHNILILYLLTKLSKYV